MMKIMKRLLLVLTAIMLVLPGSITIVSAKDKAESESDGYVASKDEVIYGTLSGTGDTKDIYIVNMLDVTKPGLVTDYGNYSSVKNLSDLSEINQSGNKVTIDAPEGKFYYQGNMDNATLPWDFSISYTLDGENITPDTLAGKDGHLKVNIGTFANKHVNQTFFENYMLQISLTFDAEKSSNISAEDGMIANAGKNMQITFTVMPEDEEEFVVEADVQDFESDGIDITAVPSTVSIDPPNTDDMTDDISTLANAIAEVNDGVADLKYGVTTLNNGALELKSGSGQYKNGINQLDNSSAELVNGSTEIKQALKTMDSSLSHLDDIDMSGLQQLTEGLSQTSSGLKDTADGLSKLKSNYADAYHALDAAISDIPTYTLSEKEIQALYQSGADQQTIDKLVETYTASKVVKGTFNQVKQGFDAVSSTLETVNKSLYDIANNLDSMGNELTSSIGNMDPTDGLAQLKKGVSSLAANYNTFHHGLVQYTGGVTELASSYRELNSGIGEFATGTTELRDGVGELHKGTTELERSTSNLPKEMTKEIDEMIAEFDKSDFDAISFVSPKNEDVYAVQFVLKTESIELEEPESVEEQEEVEKSFWTKLKELFSK